MSWGESNQIIGKILILGLIIFSVYSVRSEIIGNPPYKSIKIPASAYGDHYDLVQDSEHVLYIAYMRGIKIFDGADWHKIEIGNNATIRRLYFLKDRVYFGGSGTIGYIYKDNYGQYQYKDITPEFYKNKFKDIWHIYACNDSVIFSSLHSVFSFDVNTEVAKTWDFSGKLGAGLCYKNRLIIQDRSVGLKALKDNKWVASQLNLKNNQMINDFVKIADESYFISSQSDDWRVIENDKIKPLNFKKKLPNLDNYVSGAPLQNGAFVLGSNNGLLSFIDTKTLQTQSFQLTNEWISKIIRINENELVILTEFEIFYLQWPSSLRIQGSETGLASSISDVSIWNDKLYAVGSAGVFLEDKQQLVYQHKLFHRLNWTNNEAWEILSLDKNRLLLAESYYLLLIDKGDNEDTQITPISQMIYPRELITSSYNPDLIYVITELDVQLLYRTEKGWQFKPFYKERAISIVEDQAGSALLSIDGSGFFQVTFDIASGESVEIKEMNSVFNLMAATKERTTLLMTNNKDIYAYNTQGIYKLENQQFVADDFWGLEERLNGEELKYLVQAENDLYYGLTAFKLLFQDKQRLWHVIDMSQYLQGMIGKLKVLNNEIKMLSNGVILTYFIDNEIEKKKIQYGLRLLQVEYKQNNTVNFLPTNPVGLIEMDQAESSINFSYVLNDVKNHANNLYRYQLIGDSNEWSEYSNDTQIRFNNLTAGEYRLNIQAMDTEKKQYNAPSYYFIINPPWYMSIYSKVLWVMLTLLTLTIIFQLLLKWREKIYEIQKQELKKIISTKTQELEKANINLQKMAHQDGLTGLSNRFYLDDFIKKISSQNIENIVVMMMDMDEFKQFNDRNGHLAGDELLKQMAQYLQQNINKPSDIVARYGGEEFIVILLNTSLQSAKITAEKIRQLIENKEKQISVSIGICMSDKQTNLKDLDAIYQLIDLADQSLYQAKNTGRNRIVVVES